MTDATTPEAKPTPPPEPSGYFTIPEAARVQLTQGITRDAADAMAASIR